MQINDSNINMGLTGAGLAQSVSLIPYYEAQMSGG